MKSKVMVQCSYCGAETEIIEGQSERPLCDKCKFLFHEEVVKIEPHVQVIKNER